MRYIRDNKTLVQKYYADQNDAPVTDLLRQSNIKTNNQLMDFSDSSWQDCPETGRSTGAYIIFYQGGPINHGTHIPGPVAQYSQRSFFWKYFWILVNNSLINILKCAKDIPAVHAELYSLSALYWATGPGICVPWLIGPP